MNNRDNFDIRFDFVRFIKFLEKNNIAATAIAAVLSDRINELTNKFFDGMILPIINRDGDGDGEKDIIKLEEMEIIICKVKFKIGQFIYALLKFIVVTYIVFIISNLLKKLITRID